MRSHTLIKMTKRAKADLTMDPLHNPGWNSASTPSRLLKSTPQVMPGAVIAILSATDRIPDPGVTCGDLDSVWFIIGQWTGNPSNAGGIRKHEILARTRKTRPVGTVERGWVDQL